MGTIIELMQGGAEIERENATLRSGKREVHRPKGWLSFGFVLNRMLEAHVHAASRLEIPGADNAAAPAPP